MMAAIAFLLFIRGQQKESVMFRRSILVAIVLTCTSSTSWAQRSNTSEATHLTPSEIGLRGTSHLVYNGPRIVYSGPRGDHHLIEDGGTAHYWWGGQRWLTRLRLFNDIPSHLIYREVEYPDYFWAFAKHPTWYRKLCWTCHGCWYYCWHKGYKVWYWVPDANAPQNGRWEFIHYAKKKIPVNAYGTAAADRYR